MYAKLLNEEPPWHEPTSLASVSFPQFSKYCGARFTCCTRRPGSGDAPPAPADAGDAHSLILILKRSDREDVAACAQHEPQYCGMCWLRGIVTIDTVIGVLPCYRQVDVCIYVKPKIRLREYEIKVQLFYIYFTLMTYISCGADSLGTPVEIAWKVSRCNEVTWLPCCDPRGHTFV